MENFIKENWFKAIISLAIIIVAGSAAYYFVVYLPHRDQQSSSQQALKVDQDNAQKCADAGQKYFDANFSEYKNGGFKVILDGPYFHFNNKIKACLLEYKLTTYDIPINVAPVDDDHRFDGYIINLLSGNTEAFVTAFWKNGKFARDFDSSEFQRFENQEMNLMQN
jgi:hypothetical protein